ncbi:MAG: hypothetical protein OEO23_16850 [Gemmatimonadota bacterium]|nr:hypothetical protein [Gemmatimonadota bacterium]
MDRPLWVILFATTLVALALMRIGTGVIIYQNEGDRALMWIHGIQAVVVVVVAAALWIRFGNGRASGHE